MCNTYIHVRKYNSAHAAALCICTGIRECNLSKVKAAIVVCRVNGGGPFCGHPMWRMSRSHNLITYVNTVQVHMHFKMNQWFPLVCLLLSMLWFKTDTTPPSTSLPSWIVLVFSNTATDYMRRRSTVIPTTKLGYNLSGRESDLVIIRMIGSFHLIWKIYCCWTKKTPPHYSQHYTGPCSFF